MENDFYIGWEARSPKRIGQFARKAVVALIVLSLLLAIGLAVFQQTIGASVFEWGKQRNFSGILRLQPYPHLLVPRPGNLGGKPGYSAYYLVAQWKFGLDPKVIEPLDGKPVTLKGTLIYRNNQTMVETAPEWIQSARSSSDPAALPQPVSLGRQTLAGEIVDSKCFFGVMNPGQLAPHRACAIRCISGGVPPVLLVRQSDGHAVYFMLVSTKGEPVNKQVLDFVAEPLEITGEVERQGDLLILRADPATYRKL